MESYQKFLDRIYSFEKKEIHYENKSFKGNPSILQKIGAENKFKNFYGDTIIFTLDDRIKEKLAGYVDLLYHSAPICFCEKLVPDTFHMTLHDLSNSPSLPDIAEELFKNELNVIEKLSEIQKYEKANIKMKSSYIFNMVDTSLVLGFYPADENSYDSLMALYSVFEDIKLLNYPLTPHITLAYYNINGFDIQACKILEDTVNSLNQDIKGWEIELSIHKFILSKI
ncbi:MAG: hypothetical protein NC321_11315 [Clostridium sp.]|nr:hypothetical protein [Clostridium sp.]